MSEPSLQLQLHNLLTAINNSLRLLYQAHSAEFKIVALIVLGYIAYRLGRSTVADPLDNDVKSIRQSLQNRQLYTVCLPKKIASFGKIRKVLFIILVILIATAGTLYYLQHELYTRRSLQQLQIAGITATGLLGAVVLIWLYEAFLAFRMKRGGYNDHLLHTKMTHIVNAFGKKTELLLKGYLCKDKYLKRKTQPAGVCVKEKCKDYRALLRQKYQCISGLVQNVLNFEWCSICRRKVPFDEYLPFESQQYIKDANASQEQEVVQRNKYLMCELQRMQQWVQNVSPCNCSKRYWLESTKEVREYKKNEKQIEVHLQQFQKNK